METSTLVLEGVDVLSRPDILDIADEPEFADLVELAVAICGVAIGHISILDSERMLIRAAKGIDVREVQRSMTFCDHAMRQEGLFIVANAMEDARFCDHPWVTGEAKLRFYAGFPLRSEGGSAIGTLCVVDQEPKRLSEQQAAALRILADQVIARLELRFQRQEAQRLRQRFESFMDSGPFVSYMKDRNGRMLYYNEPLAKRFHVSRQAMLGKTDAELWPLELAQTYREHDLQVLRSGEPSVTQEKTPNGDGSFTTWQSHKFVCTGNGGEPVLGGVSVDITSHLRREEELVRVHKELQQANLLLGELATRDALTGLPLRQVFDERMRVAFREAHKAGEPLSMLMIDVDNFKRHNDSFGHPHGDAVLQALAGTLRSQIRPTDLITRCGGEEFAVGLIGTSCTGAMVLASRLLAAVRTLEVNGAQITVSIGVAEADVEMTTADLLEHADQALLCAKRSGKDKAVCWASALMDEANMTVSVAAQSAR